MNQRPVVLVVDDLPQNVEVIGEALVDLFDIQCACSGPEALRLAATTPPDLVLLDVMMPGMDGYEVCRALQAEPRTAAVPILFVTARTDAESESAALAAGAVDFIHKPVNRDVLRARVRLHLTLKARELELEALNTELAQLNAELERRVEERTQTLRDALLQAEAAHRAKSLFLANINHELRTPMNAMLGLATLIARRSDEPRLRSQVEQMQAAGQQLLELIGAIIDIADLEAGRVQLEPVDFPLIDLLDTAEATVRPRALAKGLRWVREIDPALPPYLRGDLARLRQILGNLLNNAVKFSAQGTIVFRALRTEANPGEVWVRFEVEDEGIGIPPERQAAIFEVFEQADNSRTRDYHGAGLGLAICRYLTDLLGGRIGVESTPERGSTFWLLVRLEVVTEPKLSAGPAAEQPLCSTAPRHNELAHLVVPLLGLLKESGIEAYMLWQQAGPALNGLLGAQAPAFHAAMENIEFNAAHRLLQAAWEAGRAASSPQPEAPDGRDDPA